MSRAGRITRRALLIGAVAVAGGAAFGVWQARRPVANPLAPDEGATLNPYVIIDQAGTTIIAPRAEMGQGVHTTLAALVAEELDVAWEGIRVLHGPAARAYYNAALLEMGAPGAEYDRGALGEALAGALRAAGPLAGMQITGGSTSVADAYDRMRLAGATAREALKEAAAQRLAVPRGALATEAGTVIAPDGTRIAYAELAEAAAALPVPDVALRPASEWKLLGRSLPRSDMLPKATGTAAYGIDTRLPGMKFATLLACPHFGGSLRGYDDTDALEVPGVEAVLDLGNALAVVAAHSWAAFEGAAALRIDWAAPADTLDSAAIEARIAAAFDRRRNARMRNDGNTTRALAAADSVIEAEYRVPYLAHAAMEPLNATALYEEGRLTLWCGNQTPLIQAQRAARAIGIGADSVTVHTPFLGGAFGRRLESDYSEYAARLARAMPGTPVQLVWTREEDMRHDFYRPAAIARMRGAVAEGRASALEARVAAQSVTRQAVRRLAGLSPPGPDKGHLEGMFDQPYRIANYRAEGYLAELDIPVGFWRSVGHSFNAFFHESFIDELAHAAGRDPLAFRLDHMREEHPPSARLLEDVAEMSGWTGSTGDGIGRGVAFCHSFGTGVAQVIEVVDDGGRIRISRAWVACEIGRALDPDIVRAQIESGLIYGLSAAVMGEITFSGGSVEQSNFHDHGMLRITGSPRIEVRIRESGGRPGGAGEPGTPPAAPALANAVFDLTGECIRSLPLDRSLRFVT